jgi:hypothetical protein
MTNQYDYDMLRKSKGGTHPWFSGHASGDDDNVCTPKSLGKTVIWREVALDLGRSGDMREVGGNTRCVDDIIQAKLKEDQILVVLRCHVTLGCSDLGNQGVCLEEKGQRLANST